MKKKMDPRAAKRILGSALAEKTQARIRLQTDRWSDPADEAQWSEDAAVAVRELDVAWTRQRQARAALSQLKAGRYGECESCGRPIGEVRLSALPWATLCVRCAAIRERMDAAREAQPQGAPRDWLDDASDAA